MTDDLARLRELSEKATPGEWQRWGENHTTFAGPDGKKIGTVGGWSFPGKLDDGRGDQEFIVACVNYARAALRDVPAPKADTEKMEAQASQTRVIQCYSCSGTGTYQGAKGGPSWPRCPRCHGSGEIVEAQS